MPRESSNFGRRIHPVTGQVGQHSGVDYPSPIGSPVYVSKPMTVEFIGEKSGYGKVIETKDAAGVKYVFAHMDGFPPNLKAGDSLSTGSVAGYTGNTGMSSGPHLHYEVRMFDPTTGRYKAYDPVTTIDPTTGKPYINNASFSPGRTPNNSSLRSSTPTKDPGYKPNGKESDRTMDREVRSLQNRRPGPTDTGDETERLLRRKPAQANVHVNPVLKLGDELID
jgi:murein DD-endopeptidase MepM/ murein hydrolase activator NlpD